MSVITAKEVTSEPVPLVVGTAIKGNSFPVCLRAIKTVDFAASIDEPPPRATTTSAFALSRKSSAFAMSSTGGSGFISEYMLICVQFFIYPAILSAVPDFLRKASVKITAFSAFIVSSAERESFPKHTSVLILNFCIEYPLKNKGQYFFL